MRVKDITKYHTKLLDMAKYCGANEQDAEDVVQDLYIKLLEIEQKEGSIDRITWNDKLNFVYIYNAIRHRVYNKKRFYKKFVPVDCLSGVSANNDLTLANIEVKQQLHKMGRYYSKLYNAYFEDTISMRKLSKESGISLSTIFFSLKHIKKELRPIFYEKDKEE